MEIDGDLCRPSGKEIIIGRKGRKKPRGTEIECPRLNSEGRRLVFDRTPHECEQDTGEEGQQGTDGGDECARGEHI